MAKVNTCLKCVFTVYNIFFAIVGGLIFLLALLCQILSNSHGGENMEGRIPALIMLYIVGSATMLIAILGAYGAQKESRVCLILFLVCMVVGSLLMIRIGIPWAMTRNKVEGILEDRLQMLLPLDQAKENAKDMVNSLQTQLKCCGLFSYKDWGDNIPSSCICSDAEQIIGKCQIVGYKVLMLQQQAVYTKTCFPIIMHYVMLIVDIMIGVALTLAALALIGIGLSSIMIHQLRYPDRPTILLSVPTVFSPAPPKYQELHNPPKY